MPADYVNKLARMFQDIKVSEDLNQEFKEAHRNNNEGLAGMLKYFLISVQSHWHRLVKNIGWANQNIEGAEGGKKW